MSETAPTLSQAATWAVEEIADFCIERPYRNFLFTRAAQIVQKAIDRELSNSPRIPAETLDQETLAHARYRTHECNPAACSPCAKLDAALRAARSEGGKP